MGVDNPNMDYRPNLDDEAGLRRRIAETVAIGGGVTAVSEKTGIPPGTLSKYVAQTSTASFTNAAKIAHAAQVGLDQVAFGSSLLGRDRLREIVRRKAEGPNQGFLPRTAPDADMILLPVYSEVQASAGPGAMPASELADGIMALDRYFLRDLGAAPEQCVVIWAKGDSMTPTFPDGAALVIDRSQMEIADGCIMVLNVAGSLVVKRVQRLLSGQIRLISDNRDYEPETLAPDQLDQVRVVGRVVYFGRTP